MSKRLKLSDLTKVVAQKAATSASKGVVISEGSETTSGKRALDDGSKGKQVAQPPESKKAKIDTGASEAPARPPIASGEGSSVRRTPGKVLGPQASVMASAATAEKILAGVILPADKEKVDRLTFDQVVTKFLHVLGQGVILGSSLAVRSRDFAESALNQKAVVESAEIEMVRAQNQAIELEGALAEEKAKGKKLAQDADARDKVIARLEARISKLERSQSVTQGRIIAAFKESDDFLEAMRGSASSYFSDGFDFCKRQLAHQYPDLGVDLEDVEMDHELLAKEEAEAEKKAAEEGAAGVEGVDRPFMSSKTILGNEESEQSLPSWISDHLGGRSYIDETNQSPSFPPVLTNSPKMDTSSLNKESNVMSQAELDNLGATYSFPPGVRLRIPGDGDTILSARQGEVVFYEAAFLAGLRLPIHPTIRKNFDSLQDLPCTVLILPQPLPDSGWYYFKARPEKNLLRGSPSNVKGWKTRFFFASGDEWEFSSGTAASDSIPRVLRSWGTPGKSCNKLLTLSEVDAKRTEAVFGKIEPKGYFEVSKVLGSRTFRKYFTAGCTTLSTSGGDNTTSSDVVSSLLAKIRLNTWESLDGVKDPFMNLLSGKSGSTISARVGAPALGEKTGGKAKAEKAVKATTAKPPTKGVVIWEKRARKGDHVIEIGEPDSSKGKEAAPPPPPKRFKSNRGATNVRGRAAEVGTSSPGGIGSESMMSDASAARRLLTRVIPAFDKKEVDQLSENDLVAKSFHALGQEHLHDIDFHMARADSAELELVKAQKRAVKAENRLAELKFLLNDSILPIDLSYLRLPNIFPMLQP
ncbi:hypothetical protein Acr_15g0008230 [Actinidia rufa]|uniref:Uncharacterized protein n=1 Tax=Actinidia rufa TaxID=165716 RepID=A0A7J0FU34_9ERIC|nr:hypothetical protein Acr_15g0008230 [Actinidia rufa]